MTHGTPPSPPHPDGGRCPVVVVDDERGILSALERLLRRDGFEVRTFTSPDEALLHLERHDAHVVLADFKMPGMDGVELLRRVKAVRPLAQRVMLTGYADPKALEDAVNRSEVFRFVAKPWDDGVLRLSVAAAADEAHTRQANERLSALLLERNEALEHLAATLEEKVEARSREVAQLSAEWELVLDAVDDPLAVLDPAGAVRRSNRAFRERFGDGARIADDARRAIAEHPGAWPAHAATAAGGRTYRLRAFATPAGVLCSLRDATEEERRERQARHAEAMQAVGLLAGGVVHELNSPLAAILAFADLLTADAGRRDADVEALSMIQRAAKRAARITEGLQRLARKGDEAERVPVSIPALFEDVVILFSPQLRGTPIELWVDPPSPTLQVTGSPSALSQLVVHLVRNAIQALEGRRGTIRLSARPREDRVIVTVADDGPGIEPALLERIWEPFFTTRKGPEGTGLGLPMAASIAQAHGGTLRVASEPGQGTRFEIELPGARPTTGDGSR